MTPSLPADLPLPADPSALVLPGPPGRLLVVLGGMPDPYDGVPRFEGAGLVRRAGAAGLLLRDLQTAWYLRGVPGWGDDLPGLAAAVRAHAEERGATGLVLVGNSAGGYAALALGALLDADEVIAVVPRSALSEPVSDALDDRRLAALRARVLEEPAVDPRLLDLTVLLREEHARRTAGAWTPYRTRSRVLHATDNPWDAGHAARLAGLPETAVSAYPRGDHQLAAVLRRSGELDALVAAAVHRPAAVAV